MSSSDSSELLRVLLERLLSPQPQPSQSAGQSAHSDSSAVLAALLDTGSESHPQASSSSEPYCDVLAQLLQNINNIPVTLVPPTQDVGAIVASAPPTRGPPTQVSVNTTNPELESAIKFLKTTKPKSSLPPPPGSWCKATEPKSLQSLPPPPGSWCRPLPGFRFYYKEGRIIYMV